MIKDFLKLLHPKYQKLILDYKTEFKPRYGHGLPPHKILFEIISKDDAKYNSLLNEAINYTSSISSIKSIKDEKDPTKPVWNSGFLPGLDIILLYTIIAKYKPEKYIEIGSGFSTKVAFKAKNEQNQ